MNVSAAESAVASRDLAHHHRRPDLLLDERRGRWHPRHLKVGEEFLLVIAQVLGEPPVGGFRDPAVKDGGHLPSHLVDAGRMVLRLQLTLELLDLGPEPEDPFDREGKASRPALLHLQEPAAAPQKVRRVLPLGAGHVDVASPAIGQQSPAEVRAQDLLDDFASSAERDPVERHLGLERHYGPEPGTPLDLEPIGFGDVPAGFVRLDDLRSPNHLHQRLVGRFALGRDALLGPDQRRRTHLHAGQQREDPGHLTVGHSHAVLDVDSRRESTRTDLDAGCPSGIRVLVAMAAVDPSLAVRTPSALVVVASDLGLDLRRDVHHDLRLEILDVFDRSPAERAALERHIDFVVRLRRWGTTGRRVARPPAGLVAVLLALAPGKGRSLSLALSFGFLEPGFQPVDLEFEPRHLRLKLLALCLAPAQVLRQHIPLLEQAPQQLLKDEVPDDDRGPTLSVAVGEHLHKHRASPTRSARKTIVQGIDTIQEFSRRGHRRQKRGQRVLQSSALAHDLSATLGGKHVRTAFSGDTGGRTDKA